jgi:hypothetical protein
MKGIITVLVVAALIAIIIPAGLGCAKTPAEFEVNGTAVQTQQNLDPNPKTENGKMTFEKNTDYWDVHGTSEGTVVTEYTMVVDTMTGKFTTEGQGTFTGKVKGKSGSFVYSTVGSGQMTSPTGESGAFTDDEIIISGTGDLANLRGSLHGEYKIDKGVATATYSGTFRFEK